MALYTAVDDGYDVAIHKSFVSLWKYVNTAHFHTDDDEQLWLDADESVPLTKASLRKELANSSFARIYESGRNDWTFKIQKH